MVSWVQKVNTKIQYFLKKKLSHVDWNRVLY